MGYVHQEYPKDLYHHTLPGVTVQDQAHHLECFKRGYREDREQAKEWWLEQQAKEGKAVAEPEPAKATEPPPPPPAPPTPPTEEELEAAARKAMHDATADEVIKIVNESTDAAALLRARMREALNSKHQGGRKSVLKAIDDRIAELAAAEPPAQPTSGVE